MQDISLDDIKIPQTVKDRLGHRITHTDNSGEFTTGHAFVRSIVLSVCADPYWGTVKNVIIRAPCELLRAGGRIVDTPCVADADILRARMLYEWLKEATGVVWVASISPLSHTLLAFLTKSGFLESALEDKTKQLAVVVPGDKFIKYMTNQMRVEWENTHKKDIMDSLHESLMKCSRVHGAPDSFMADSERFRFFHFYR